MNSEWKYFRIEEIAAEMSDAPFGSNLKSIDYQDSGALVVQGKNIQGLSCDWSDRRYVSIEKYNQLAALLHKWQWIEQFCKMSR